MYLKEVSCGCMLRRPGRRGLVSHAAHSVLTHGMREKAAWRPVSPTLHLQHSNVKLTVGDVTAHLVLGHDQVLGDGLVLLLVVGHRCTGFRNVSLAIRWADSRNQSRYYQAARRPSSSAHGLHAQRSHAYYAVASQVSSHTMAPKPTEAFGCFPKKGTIVKFTTHLTVLKISDSIELWCFPISQYTFSNSKPALSLLKSTTIIPSSTHWKK